MSVGTAPMTEAAFIGLDESGLAGSSLLRAAARKPEVDRWEEF